MTRHHALALRLFTTCLAPAALVGAAPATAGLAIDTHGFSADSTLTYSEIVEFVAEEPVIDDAAFDDAATDTADDRATSRFADVEGDYRPSRTPIDAIGPFFLVAPDTVEMIGTVDSATPRQFTQLMAAHPGVARLVMVECPGSVDEDANHRLARAVRRAGLTTIVPDGGSVRSGAVDLFLAGTTRLAAPTAEFGVHSWRDEDGMQADDFAANDPVNTEYLAYYREMGLSAEAARQFYALTNSVPFEDVRTLGARDMARLGLAEVVG